VTVVLEEASLKTGTEPFPVTHSIILQYMWWKKSRCPNNLQVQTPWTIIRNV